MINELLSRATYGQPEPMVGMGATILMYSDRRAATIEQVFQIGRDPAVTVRCDKSRVISGSIFDGSAVYEFEPNEFGMEHAFRFDGVRWREVVYNDDRKRWRLSGSGDTLRIGERDEYRDPNF